MDAPTTTFVRVELFACNGSAVRELTEPVLVSVPVAPLLTFVAIVNVPELPESSTLATHETVPVDPTAGVVQLHPEGTVIDENVALVGSTNVKNGLLASASPLFVTALE